MSFDTSIADEIYVKNPKMINMRMMEHGANPVYMPKCNLGVGSSIWKEKVAEHALSW